VDNSEVQELKVYGLCPGHKLVSLGAGRLCQHGSRRPLATDERVLAKMNDVVTSLA
jgi:hypothetical protein